MKPSTNKTRVDWTRYRPIFCDTQRRKDWRTAFSQYQKTRAGAVYAVRGEDGWTCGCCGKPVRVVG